MVKIAIMGFGTVGNGVLEVLQINRTTIFTKIGEPIQVKYILDIRDFSNHPFSHLFVKDLEKILQDSEIKVVVETIGGINPAFDFVKKCLQKGISVVTSNKELVAVKGAQLMQIAKEKGGAFLFEASVGGGMPIVTPLHQCLAANVIGEIQGILNGTTNFILTKMERENISFLESLKYAQELGYAETKDPSDDIDGIDACRKIAILAGIAFGQQIYPENIPTKGIREICAEDMQAIASLGSTIKLIARAKKQSDSIFVGVEPMILPRNHKLAMVDDVFNGVLVKGDILGDVFFYGKGAGKLPTASAVVADVIDALKNGSSVHQSLYWTPSEPNACSFTDFDSFAYYIRVEGCNCQELQKEFPKWIKTGETGVGAYGIIPLCTPKQIKQITESIKGLGWKIKILMRILKEQ